MMFSTITTAPSTTIPKSRAPSDSRLAGMPLSLRQVAANNSEKEEKNDDNKNHAFGEIVEDGVGGVAKKVAAVQERHDFYARRQDVVVELIDPLVNGVESGLGIRAFAQKYDAGTHVVVIDDDAVFAMDGTAKLAKTNLRPLGDYPDISDP